MIKTVLLTGFEPFNKASINPAWEAVRTLGGWSGEHFRVEVLRSSWAQTSLDSVGWLPTAEGMRPRSADTSMPASV